MTGTSDDWGRRLAGYCLRFPGLVVAGFTAAALSAAVAALMPLAVREVIDQSIVTHREAIGPWLLLLLSAGLLRYATSFVRRYCGPLVSSAVAATLRKDVFASLQRLDGRQQDQLRTGQVISRAITDVSAVEFSLASLPLLASNTLMLVLSLIFMAVLSLPLAIIAIATAPVLLLLSRRSMTALSPAFRAYSQQAGAVAEVVEQSVSGVRVVKAFGQEEREQHRFEVEAIRLYHAGVHRALQGSRFFPTLNAIPVLGQVGVLALGGSLALTGHITLGTFVAFATYLATVVQPVRWLVNQLPAAVEAKAGLQRLLLIIDTKPTVVDRPSAVEAEPGPAAIELSDVTFGYDADRPILRGLTLRIESGETVALVGESGCGKSTVGLLLARFYEAQGGVVRLGGTDVRDIRLASLRSRIGMVFDESMLFADSIRANIAFGRTDPEPTDAEVRSAARAAQSDAFISELPDGYDTVIGERGLTLSGGQRQRIALARSLLAEPEVLVLDDATSAVDAVVEAEIQATLREILRDRTTILVAHRQSTLRLADRIAVLHQGRLIDIGTHAELVRRCERYRRMLSSVDDEGTASKPVEGDELALSDAWPDPAPSDRPANETTGPIDADLGPARSPEGGIRGLIRPIRMGIVVVAAVMAFDAVAQLAIPWLARRIVDDGVTRGDSAVVATASLVALGTVVTAWRLRIVQERAIGKTGERIRLWLEVKANAHLQRLGLDFYEREGSGQIMTRMTSDISAVTTFIQRGLGTLAVAALLLVGAIALMLSMDAKLTAALALLLPVYAAAVFVYRRRADRAYSSARDRLSEVNAYLQECIAGIRTIQAYGQQKHTAIQFALRVTAHRKALLTSQLCQSLFVSFTEFMSDIAVVVVLGMGAVLVDAGTLTQGGLVAFVLCVGTLFAPVQLLSTVLDSYQRASVGYRRLDRLLRTPISTPPSEAPRPVETLAGKVSFHGVSLTYPTSEDRALRDLSLTIHAGETVAIVGETGAGKSSMLKLVARFYDPTSGAIRVDGTDLVDLDLLGYRRRLGLVPQEGYLFPGTVADAIAYGRPDARRADIERAARAIGAHEMITTLRDGYLHQVGERGHNLSSGQRQLLALARAQLVDPDILLLDEATATLDLATEAAVTRAMFRLSKPRTTLIIAHRLTTAALANRIFVLHRGRLIESGDHDQLLAASGRYAQLWQAFTMPNLPDNSTPTDIAATP